MFCIYGLLVPNLLHGMDDDRALVAAAAGLQVHDDGEGEDERAYPMALVVSPFGGVLNEQSISDLFCALVREEQESISGAVYEFNFGRVARALGEAGDRHIPIELVVDQKYRRDNPSAPCPRALLYLMRHRSTIRRANVFGDTRGAKKDDECQFVVMHNKFFVFGRNERSGGPLCWTGSFNFTGQAEKASWENVVVLDDEASVQTFLTAFAALQLQSSLLAERDLSYGEERDRKESARLIASGRGTADSKRRFAATVIAKTRRINEHDGLA